MSPTSFIPYSYVPSSPTLSFSSLPLSLIPHFFCANSLPLPLHLPLLDYNPTTPPPPPPPVTILVSATLNNFIMLSPCGHHRETVRGRKRESINQLTFQSLDHSLAWLEHRWPIHCTVVLCVHARTSQFKFSLVVELTKESSA